MSIDRSKFKKSTASQMVQADKDLNKTMGKREQGFSNGHEVEEGTNLFRIYPVHPDIADSDPRAVFAVPYVQTFIPAIVDERDKDGKVVTENGQPKKKTTVKPVYNAKVHGGMPKDLIEEYIALANRKANELKLSKDQREEFMIPIYGKYYSKGNPKNVNGINYPQVWIVYADKYAGGNPTATPIFDELRLKKSIKDRLNKIAAVEAANDPMGTDPFTDIEEGRAIKVLKDSQAVPATNVYTTELDNSSETQVINGKSYKMQKFFPLTDSQLEHFLKQEPLQVKYGKKLATRKNFETQLAGLEMVDQKWKLGIFDMPEWNDVVLEIDGYYPENDAAATTEHTAPVEDAVEEETSGDKFDLLDRKELQEFAKENKTGILVKPGMSDDAVREKLREWEVNSVIPHVDLPTDNVEGEAESVIPDVVAPVVSTGGSAKDRLAALRAKTQAAA